jgi:hypothetical protein
MTQGGRSLSEKKSHATGQDEQDRCSKCAVSEGFHPERAHGLPSFLSSIFDEL